MTASPKFSVSVNLRSRTFSFPLPVLFPPLAVPVACLVGLMSHQWSVLKKVLESGLENLANE
jgi:hypothetical protein